MAPDLQIFSRPSGAIEVPLHSMRCIPLVYRPHHLHVSLRYIICVSTNAVEVSQTGNTRSCRPPTRLASTSGRAHASTIFKYFDKYKCCCLVVPLSSFTSNVKVWVNPWSPLRQVIWTYCSGLLMWLCLTFPDLLFELKLKHLKVKYYKSTTTDRPWDHSWAFVPLDDDENNFFESVSTVFSGHWQRVDGLSSCLP